jgi:hypothetical protein
MDEDSYSWWLGGDSDCETCGTSMNELSLQRRDGDVWLLSYMVGCTGGDEVYSDSPDWESKVEQIVSAASSFPGFDTDDEAVLRTLISDQIGHRIVERLSRSSTSNK